MATGNAMALNELVGRRVRPEVILRFSFGVVQCTRTHCIITVANKLKKGFEMVESTGSNQLVSLLGNSLLPVGVEVGSHFEIVETSNQYMKESHAWFNV